MAVASVGAVLNRMRKNAYVVEANTIVKALKNEAVTDTSILPTEEDEEDKIIPLSDIELQNGIKSPYGSAYSEDSYVKIKKLSGVGVYAYSICIVDAKGNGIPETNIDNVTRTSVTTDVERSTEPEGVTTYYANGTAVYFNPVSGEKCDSASAVSTPPTKTGCMKWYAFLDSEEGATTINLLLDHNTTNGSQVVWNSTNSNLNGPSELLTRLWADTDNWTGVPTRTDTYTINNGTSNYTINYNNHKARLITANEIAKITNNTSFNELTSTSSNYFYFNTKTTTAPSSYTVACWLYDYTNGGASFGAIGGALDYGIWTATAISGSSTLAWYIYRGKLDVISEISSFRYGPRPVITIPKSIIE